ncbi:MAG: ABC transporter permease, partial [Desulfobacteraceae bacterium]
MESIEKSPHKDIRHHFHWIDHFFEGWSVFWENPLGKIGMALLGLFSLMAAGSFIPPMIDPIYHPMTGVDPEISSSVGPSLRHWLGTDFMGRDIMSQLLAGARVA